jgi:queuine tRNA-ribosyltransferase
VPLATKATVKGLLPAEVAALGYEMVLGNTFHLLLNPGPELI